MPRDSLWLGGCLCGSIRFEARGKADWVALCHCESCRKHTGGILNSGAGFKKSQVRLFGQPAKYASSPGVKRSFCRDCGTALAYENELWPDDIHLFLGAFDRPEKIKPEFHIFFEEHITWLELTDKLPRYRTTPSAGDIVEM